MWSPSTCAFGCDNYFKNDVFMKSLIDDSVITFGKARDWLNKF